MYAMDDIRIRDSRYASLRPGKMLNDDIVMRCLRHFTRGSLDPGVVNRFHSRECEGGERGRARGRRMRRSRARLGCARGATRAANAA